MSTPTTSTQTDETTLTHTPEILVIGLNHRTAPVELRERFHLDHSQTLTTLQAFKKNDLLDEALIVSTCNRLEIYAVSQHPKTAERDLYRYLATHHHLSEEDLYAHTYVHRGISAIHHGLRVIGSLDSLVLGEPQIVGQMKDAYHHALEHESLGFYLNKFFTHAFYTAKRMRSETQIGQGAVSVGYAACELGRQIFGDLKNRNALVIGAGEIGERIVEHLATQALGEIFIANRSLERAHALQTRFGGTVIPFSDIHAYLGRVDIVMSSIAVDQPILSKRDVEPKLKERNSPLFLIDVAVPRSLDPDLNSVSSVYLFNIDDLEKAISENKKSRMEEAEKAERIAEQEAEALYLSLFGDTVTPTISSLSQKLHAIKARELERTFKKNPHLPLETQEILARCADAIVNKILHDPILKLRNGPAQDSKVKSLLESISALFNLE